MGSEIMDMILSDSDWESFSESGSEDLEVVNFLYGGQAQNILSSLEASIGKIDDFLSLDREFVHGDIVCFATEPSGQMGKVINVDMVVDLESVHGKVIKDVNSKKLLRIRSISVGDYVVQGSWLGRVEKIVDSLTILFDDGTKCEVSAMDQEKIVPISSNFVEDPQYPFYPGQRVKVKLSTISNSRWLCGKWKEHQLEGTVCSVKAGLVLVDWIASASVGNRMNLPAPHRFQYSEKLTLLSCFLHANWQLGEWCKLADDGHQGFMEQAGHDASISKVMKEPEKAERGSKGRDQSRSFEEIFVIVRKKTKVDVVWQDGNYSLELDSQSILPINIINSHEFWPEQFVLEKGTCDEPHVSHSERWGIVIGVDAKERTVKVKWNALPSKHASDSGGTQMEETMSAYELAEHPEYSYCLGDTVFRVHSQLAEQANQNHGTLEVGGGAETAPEDKNLQNEYQDDSYLSDIGNVMGFKDGIVAVKWANGLVSKVTPHEISRLDKYESLTSSATLYEGSVDELNQEVIDHNKPLCGENGKDYNCTAEDIRSFKLEPSSYFIPQSAIGFFSSIAATLFGSLGSASSAHCFQDANSSGSLSEKEVMEACDLCTEAQPLVERDLYTPSSSTNKSSSVGHFDMVNDCSEHHFLDGAGRGLVSSQVKGSWLKKVQKEWSLLEKNLPETIFVRIYEERMDLLRAAIVGAPGTPYHDGLFFFDIFLPPEYPAEPPLVHYHSGGLRINPNLYESGKVCLSLLNTWSGTGTEVWNPGTSTILQVLLSLQALVLNEKPYFNEAGYDKQMGRVEGEKNSMSYNENAFLGNCRSMLNLLRKPPKHFESLVEEHFKQRSEQILQACKAYMEGAPVGYAASGCGENGSSTGFKIMLAKIFPKLTEAFAHPRTVM